MTREDALEALTRIGWSDVRCESMTVTHAYDEVSERHEVPEFFTGTLQRFISGQIWIDAEVVQGLGARPNETVYDSIDDAIEGLNRGLAEMEAMKRDGGT